MEAPFVRSYPASQTRRYHRVAHIVSLVGPVASAAGLIWAILQPYRLTLLHPHGQGFWWLVAEPPLLLILVGVLFALFVARPLISDLEAHDATAR
jgi:hypothetical protein